MGILHVLDLTLVFDTLPSLVSRGGYLATSIVTLSMTLALAQRHREVLVPGVLKHYGISLYTLIACFVGRPAAW